jgi:hypothetical protein
VGGPSANSPWEGLLIKWGLGQDVVMCHCRAEGAAVGALQMGRGDRWGHPDAFPSMEYLTHSGMPSRALSLTVALLILTLSNFPSRSLPPASVNLSLGPQGTLLRPVFCALTRKFLHGRN